MFEDFIFSNFSEWSETPFCPEIIKNLEALKFKVPRNIQKVAMPAIVEGFDVVVQSETGSGKTATFMLPIVHKLEEQYKADAAQEGSPPSRLCRPSCIVFSPTRELARQLFDEAKKLCRGTSVRANVCYGDYSYRENLNSLRTVGCDILIGTIGRIHHFLTGNGREPELKSDSIKFVVFDEVDELLKDNNFCQLQSVCENKEMIPRDSRQHLFFSATYNQIHKNIVDNIGRPKQLITFRAQASGNKRITQEIKCIRSGDRKNFLISLFNKGMFFTILFIFLLYTVQITILEMAENGKIEKTIVFVEKKRDADTLSLRLSEDHKCKSITMHADRTQQEREEHFAKFKQGEHQVLVATNVASRGLDVHDLNRVSSFCDFFIDCTFFRSLLWSWAMLTLIMFTELVVLAVPTAARPSFSSIPLEKLTKRMPRESSSTSLKSIKRSLNSSVIVKMKVTILPTKKLNRLKILKKRRKMLLHKTKKTMLNSKLFSVFLTDISFKLK